MRWYALSTVSALLIILACCFSGVLGAKTDELLKSVDLPYPSPTATQADWGNAKYDRCKQTYSWSEIIHGYKNMNRSTFMKMGGLGKLMELDGYETWQCFIDHNCSVEPGNWFCFVYHETNRVFTPWGENSQLKLVPEPKCVEKTPTQGTVCHCDRGYTANGGACARCVAGKYKAVSGDGACQDCIPGKYLTTEGNDAEDDCVLCEKGKYSTVTAANYTDTCQDCPAGKYLNTVNRAH